ncbi:MAG: DNA polymerase III subunit alpha [Bacilli bacterium]|nr:DNA polymerase III subunit alpha [Bacilli bacterium]
MYYPISIKTDYSLYKSLIKINDLISYAKKNSISTLGILDDNLNGSHLFYNGCIKNDIKPIIGVDITLNDNHIYLYPSNYDALINLFKLTKVIDKDIDVLKKYSKDVICVLPYEYKDLYDELKNIYNTILIGYINNDEKKNALLISDKVVYINLILSLDKENSKYINYLEFIDKGLKLGEQELKDYSKNVLDLSIDEDTSCLADLINIEYPKDKRYIPHYDETIKDSKEYLINLANKGLAKRLNNNITKEYQDRLDYELKVISDMGFVDYFLIVFDYVRYAIKNDVLVGAGRGSAVGSLVAYSLGITSIDPLKYNLIFERFLNPERVTMPDIDIDFDAEKRDIVIDYVRNKYGEDRVAHIIAYGTFQAREAIRAVAKIYNMDEKKISELSDYIDSKKSLSENLTKELKQFLYDNDSLNVIYNEALKIEGIKKHVGVHAAGVVISSVNLTDVIPLIYNGDEYLTGYDKDELEEMGLLKMDFLSIKNLTIISNILKDIEKNTGKKLDINKIDLDDKKVYELFSRGDTVGVFQFESAGMKNFLKRLKPKEFNDLIMINAMYRPGPMSEIDNYVKRHNENVKITYPDDSLKDILEPTYGIMIYQEQVMQILVKMGGFSFGEADIVRRAISKKKLQLIEEAKDKFINNSIKNGYTEQKANEVYDLVVKFADYGFNKSHSVAYAFIGYQMAYLKVNYPEYYYINILNNNIGGEAKTKEYIDEIKRVGINILKPDINKSDKLYVKENDGIRLPLRCIKGVGIVAADNIIKLRGDKPFKDIFDFLSRINKKDVNKKVLEVLIDADVFASFGYNRNTLKYNLDTLINYSELISDLDESLVNKPEIVEVEEAPIDELMKKEKELFGFYISSHPSSKYPNMFKLIDIRDSFNKKIKGVYLIEKINMIKTKKDEDMCFITASDETATGDFVVFPKTVNQIVDINAGDVVEVEGIVERRVDKFQIVVNRIEKI